MLFGAVLRRADPSACFLQSLKLACVFARLDVSEGWWCGLPRVCCFVTTASKVSALVVYMGSDITTTWDLGRYAAAVSSTPAVRLVRQWQTATGACDRLDLFRLQLSPIKATVVPCGNPVLRVLHVVFRICALPCGNLSMGCNGVVDEVVCAVVHKCGGSSQLGSSHVYGGYVLLGADMTKWVCGTLGGCCRHYICVCSNHMWLVVVV